MGLYIIKGIWPNNLEKYLGREYEPNFHYSSLTAGDSSFSETFINLDTYFAHPYKYGLTIFESLKAANQHVLNMDYWIYSEAKIKVINLIELDALIEEYENQNKGATK